MKALLLVDIQNDFLPTGSLPVPAGDEIVDVVNRMLAAGVGDVVVATRDYHPPDHGSFASQHPGKQPFDVVDLNGLEQVLWPDHCVQGTPGSELVPELDHSRIAETFVKGTDPGIDSYSGFFDNGRRKATGLGDWLKERGVTEVLVTGLAADVCVKFTALDALKLGFATKLVRDATRGVDLKPGDVDRALGEMRDAGAEIVDSASVMR